MCIIKSIDENSQRKKFSLVDVKKIKMTMDTLDLCFLIIKSTQYNRTFYYTMQLIIWTSVRLMSTSGPHAPYGRRHVVPSAASLTGM